MVSGTIAGHLEHYVRLGAVKIEQLVPKEKIMKITRYVQANGSDKGLTAIKAALGDEVSYADIRLVLAAEKRIIRFVRQSAYVLPWLTDVPNA